MRVVKKSKLSLTAKKSWYGRLFILPFYLGFLFFFLKPLIQSLRFAFNDVTMGPNGYTLLFTKFENIDYVIKTDRDFTTNLVSSLGQMLWQVPVIIIVSLFFAMLLNQKFKGRVLVRAIFFLPVIIASGIVISIIKSDVVASSALSGSMVSSGDISQTSALNDVLVQSGLSEKVVSFITNIADNLFSIIWQTGIQMIIFLAGLQSIPATLYEASAMEGATKWEDFWKITLPMIKPIALVNTVYTIVDYFTSTDNKVMEQVLSNIRELRLGWASAMAWIYFAVIGIILALVLFLFEGLKNSDKIVKVKGRRV